MAERPDSPLARDAGATRPADPDSERVFAVVGHVNKGKSSVVSTLTEDDTVRISREPGTTRECREFPLRVDGRALFTLVDTPGFEQARHALDWMRRALAERGASAAQRPEIVAAFVREHARSGRFPEECELLRPILRGAGILYVVDGSRPYSPEYEAEMEILRWTGQPRMALINQIGEQDHAAVWRAALDQYFSLTRPFDAHAAGLGERLRLLEAMRELRDEWRPALDEAIAALRAERARRRRTSARAIANMLADQLGLALEERVGLDADPEPVKAALRRRYRDQLRRRERACRDEIEGEYLHHALEREEGELSLAWEDLFAESTWLRLGLNRRQLAATGAVGGALAGGALDVALGGSSFLAGALIGGAVGGVSGWFSDRKLAAVSVKGLRLGGKAVAIGPLRNPQFPWIALDRALLHFAAVANRAHAVRGKIVLPSGGGYVSGLSPATRREIERRLGVLRKGAPAAASDPAADENRLALAGLIEALLEDIEARQPEKTPAAG